jgi:hypothetical protein
MIYDFEDEILEGMVSMIKKTISVALVFLLAAAMLTACGSPAANGGSSSNPADTNASATSQPTAKAAAQAGGAATISESFNNFEKVKGDALTRITTLTENNTDLAMFSLTLLPFSVMDLTLLPLTVLSEDTNAAAMALGVFGMSGIKIDKSGNTSTITYTDSTGKKTVQTSQFDAATESLKSTLTDDTGKETLFFEYVRIGTGYAAQYYSVDSSGTQVYTAFFDATDVAAFGVKTTTEKPASIYGNTGVTVDIVKSADTYIIAQGAKVTTHENGVDKTY